jgi:hypothetical protein
MRREDRFRCLRIDGERIANVDFGQLYLRLAYLHLGLTVPERRDLYEIPGLSDGGEERRDALKVIVNAMLLANRPLRNWPDTGSAKLLPQGTTFRDVQDAITVAHWPIRELFGVGIGNRFAFLESKILLETLFQLHNDGDGRGPVCALPLHDSVLVARSRAEEAKAVMLDAFERVTGSPHGAVKVDAGDN